MVAAAGLMKMVVCMTMRRQEFWQIDSYCRWWIRTWQMWSSVERLTETQQEFITTEVSLKDQIAPVKKRRERRRRDELYKPAREKSVEYVNDLLDLSEEERIRCDTISLSSHQNIGLHTGARADVVLLIILFQNRCLSISPIQYSPIPYSPIPCSPIPCLPILCLPILVEYMISTNCKRYLIFVDCWRDVELMTYFDIACSFFQWTTGLLCAPLTPPNSMRGILTCRITIENIAFDCIFFTASTTLCPNGTEEWPVWERLNSVSPKIIDPYLWSHHQKICH